MKKNKKNKKCFDDNPKGNLFRRNIYLKILASKQSETYLFQTINKMTRIIVHM